MSHKLGAPHTRALYSESEHMREFHKLMDQQSHRWGHRDIYVDFLHLMMCCFLSDRTPEHPREKEYMAIEKKYHSDSGQMDRFAQMFALVMQYMKDTDRECLSELWEVYCANENLGQFFTPWHVCDLMSGLQIPPGTDFSQYTADRKCGISDPSCGGGRLFIAAAKHIPAKDIPHCFFHGVDIDANCCHIAALNLLFFNLNGFIVHGNALSLETRHVFETRHTLTGGIIREITDRAVMEKIMTMGLHPCKEEGKPSPAPAQSPAPVIFPQPVSTEQLCFNF